jgi:hypothetical protein
MASNGMTVVSSFVKFEGTTQKPNRDIQTHRQNVGNISLISFLKGEN